CRGCLYHRALPSFPTRRSSDLAVLAAELERLTGVAIGHAAAVDLAGFPAVVDELGGYEICVDYPLRDLKSGLELDEGCTVADGRSEEHTSELQSREKLVCRLRL